MVVRSQTFIFATMIMVSILLIVNIIEIQNAPETIQFIQYNTTIEMMSPPQKPATIFTMNRLHTLSFVSWIGIPHFYIKRGERELRFMNEKLLTLCTVCSSNILHQARTLATNYKSGPLSIAVYIDEGIEHHTIEKEQYLHSVFDEYFYNVSNPYDIYIGLVYINKSHRFWKQLRFTNETEMAWKIPVNAMRNLAEYQVSTKWLMTVDVDFEFYSWSINNAMYLYAVLNHGATSYSDRTMFIVPSFAMNSSYIESNKRYSYHNLTRAELYSLVPNQIEPFYVNTPFQNCTDYQRWYLARKDYELDFEECESDYEPFFIIDSNTSRAYKWDSYFTGRQYDKIQRVQYLRYNHFRAIVLRNMFMIHVNRLHITQNITHLLKIYSKHINNFLSRRQQYLIGDLRQRKEGNKSSLDNFYTKTKKLQNAKFPNFQIGHNLKRSNRNLKRSKLSEDKEKMNIINPFSMGYSFGNLNLRFFPFEELVGQLCATLY